MFFALSCKFERFEGEHSFKAQKLYACVMKDDDDKSVIRVNPLRLLTDENYCKLFPEDKSTADDPFIFNMDNVQIHIGKDAFLVTGEMNVTAFIYKVDLEKGVKQPKLTNRRTFPCKFLGKGHLVHSYMKDDRLYYMYDPKKLALMDADNLNIIKLIDIESPHDLRRWNFGLLKDFATNSLAVF